MDVDVLVQAEKSRHVRDMWEAAHKQTDFCATELAIGSLAVIGKYYTLYGERVIIPGHIGIVTGRENGLDIIHADPRTGRVKEGHIKNLDTVMGYIAVNLL